MKTLIIYNTLEELQYGIVEGDYSDLNGVMINACDQDESKVEKACSLLFDEESNYRIELSEDVSLIESKDWDFVSVITFLM